VKQLSVCFLYLSVEDTSPEVGEQQCKRLGVATGSLVLLRHRDVKPPSPFSVNLRASLLWHTIHALARQGVTSLRAASRYFSAVGLGLT
jgi:hypothetical protein